MKQKFYRRLLFPTPIWMTTYNFDLKEIESFCLEYEKTNQSVLKSNAGGWQSDDLDLSQDNIVTKLLKKIEKDCKEQLSKEYLVPDMIIQNAWININRQGHSNARHSHPYSIISGCIYISNSDKESKISFESPKILQTYSEAFRIGIETNYLVPNRLLETVSFHENFEAIPNTALFFPSWLFHSVTENKSSNPRISIAFNFDIKE